MSGAVDLSRLVEKATGNIDKAVRQAANYAVNKQGLVDNVLQGTATGSAGPIAPAFDWVKTSVEPYPYDPEKAKTLLAELGWTPGADGMLEKDGKPFALTLTTYPDRPELPLIAAVLQDQLKEIGVALTINSTKRSSASARFCSWVRYCWALIMITPSLVIRLSRSASKRSL